MYYRANPLPKEISTENMFHTGGLPQFFQRPLNLEEIVEVGLALRGRVSGMLCQRIGSFNFSDTHAVDVACQ